MIFSTRLNMYLLVVLHIIRFVKNAFLNIDAFHFKNENILLLNMCFYKVIKLKYGKVQKVFDRFRISLKDVTCFELFAAVITWCRCDSTAKSLSH